MRQVLRYGLFHALRRTRADLERIVFLCKDGRLISDEVEVVFHQLKSVDVKLLLVSLLIVLLLLLFVFHQRD